MRTIIDATKSFTKRDIINSRSGFPLQDFDGDSLTIPEIVAAAIMKDTDTETGEIKDITVLKTSNSHYFTSISATVYDCMEDVIGILDEESTISVRVDKRKSKGNRDFLTLVVL